MLKLDLDSRARHLLAVGQVLRHDAAPWTDDWLELPPGYLQHLNIGMQRYSHGPKYNTVLIHIQLMFFGPEGQCYFRE